MRKLYTYTGTMLLLLQLLFLTGTFAQTVNPNGNIYYIRQDLPWGESQTNILDGAWGAGNYIVNNYSIAPGTLISNSTAIIYLEGSYYANPSTLLNFLNANRTALEDWVYRGGRLFLNAAPNEGGNINFGFGGVTLQYSWSPNTHTPNASVTSGQSSHPIFNAVGSSWSGGYFGHAVISGGSFTSLITGYDYNQGVMGVVLAEKQHGAGLVLFGGITTTNFHYPQPAAANLRINILRYLKSFVGVPPQTISTSIGTTSLCVGNDVSVGYTATGTYTAGNTFTAQLSNASGNFASPVIIGSTSATTSGTINATIPTNTPAGSGYRIRVVSSNPGVTGTDNGSNLVINARPTASISAGGPTTFCPGGSVILTASAGDAYAWSNGATTQSITVNSSGNYSVTVTANGCSATSAGTQVTVNQGPTLDVTALKDVLCEGGSTQLTATVSGTSSKVTLGGVAGSTGFLDAPAGTGALATCDCPPGYVAVGYTGRTGSWMDQLQLACKPLNPDGSLGASVAYTSPTGAYGGGPNGPYLFSGNTVMVGANMHYSSSSWMNSIQGYGKSISDILASTPSNSNITTLGRMGGGTPAGNAGDAFVPAGYVITGMEASAGVAYVDRVRFRYSPLSNVLQAAEVLWSTGARGASITISPTVTTTYTASVSDINGCVNTSELTVTVNAKPTVSVSPEGTASVCVGGSTLLTATAAAGSGEIQSYQWLKGGQPIAGANGSTFSVTEGGNYSVTVVNTNDCEVTSGVVTVSAVTPPASVSIIGPEQICPNGTVLLRAPAAPNGETYLYQWYEAAASDIELGETNATYQATKAGSYYVVVTRVTPSGSCPIKSAVHTVTESVPEPVSIIGPEYVCEGSTIELSAPATPEGKTYQYQWFTTVDGGTPVADATSQAYTTGQGAVYYVVVTDVTETSSCPVKSAEHTLTVGDIVKPTFTVTPKPEGAAFARTTSSGCTYEAVGTEFNAEATDNCELVSLTYSLQGATMEANAPANTSLAGVKLNKGTTTITWTAVDATGLVETYSFDVEVTDDDVPVLTCPQLPQNATGFSRNTDPGVCTYTIKAEELLPTATDNCDDPLAYYYKVDDGDFALASTFTDVVLQKGSTTITWKAVDGAGNTSALCSYTVTVADNQDPTITAPAAITVNTSEDGEGDCTTTTALGTPVTADNCGVASVVATVGEVVIDPAIYPFRTGTTEVTWTVTDVSGRTASATQQVTVVDDEVPTISSVPVYHFCYGEEQEIAAPVYNDNCGGTMSPSRSDGKEIGEPYAPGKTTITWTVTDGAGLTASSTTEVYVNQPITVSIPDVKALNYPGLDPNTVYLGYTPAGSLTLTAIAAGGNGTYRYDWSPVSGSGSSIVVSPTSIGENTFTVQVNDGFDDGRCSAEQSITVIVEDASCGNDGTKVNMCHVANANDPTHVKTICIDGGSVMDHLLKGCSLDACPDGGTVAVGVEPEAMVSGFALKAMPNPTTNYFTLKVESGNLTDKVVVRVLDIQGRLVELKQNVQPNQTLRFGDNYRPGIYFVEVMQGAEKAQTKLIKMSH